MQYNLTNTSDIEANNMEFIYDNELDDFSSISSDISHAFYESNVVFSMNLFEVIIPVETWGDLPHFLDGFEDYIKFLFLKEIISFEYELFGQGLETTIIFQKNCNRVMIREKEYLKGGENTSLLKLQKDATSFFLQLLNITDSIIPQMRNNSWFKKWETVIRNIIDDHLIIPPKS